MREEQLLAYLKEACARRKHRVGGMELERVLNLSGTDLRKLVNKLRQRGIPVGSDRNGYFYDVTAGEVYTTIRQLRQMVTGLERAIAGLEDSLERFSEVDDEIHTQAQRSGLRVERRSDKASELLPRGGSEQAESATT